MAKRNRDAQPETNVEFVTRLMEVSNHGALAQVFVLDALEKWSKIISESDVEKLDTPFMSGKAWQGVAKEIHTKITNRFA